MSSPGDDPTDLLVRARTALLDALDALAEQRDAVIVIGAQAVYLRTGGIDVALAEATKDSDVALDPRRLTDDPRIETAMREAGFLPSATGQPGAWVNTDGIPVDLMVPEQLAGPGSSQTRGARIPPHDKKAARRARGLEATLIDHDEIAVSALEPTDGRTITVNVAGPAALLVAKLHKLGERANNPARLNDKDAHDAYRLLRAIETEKLRAGFTVLLDNELSREVTREALDHLAVLFADSADALGSTMAGRAEEGVGEPEEVAVAVSILAGDLLTSLGRR
ncbi:GSU2403 family nucleotidyltransferase fold protein [Sinomonas sp. ASV322]|uniref:GSU2403 family nucleotidyltransferase fold protein n=1 Tax=Sinomonas sp. ASV322 TaxID=3041920 RepID=UPI0027DB77E2|nr:GSU2403 family nucleotidyltransferase fold protein [Sinomonas sp. ASV322]MDQ4500749.1 GSU2403 family nucleotidyltransferase fold protein [Sinomonas sp. ASV322]